jgi:hypothetical protein
MLIASIHPARFCFRSSRLQRVSICCHVCGIRRGEIYPEFHMGGLPLSDESVSKADTDTP